MTSLDWRTTLLQSLQRRIQSLVQPIASEQLSFNRETARLLEVLRQDIARVEAATHEAKASVLFSRWLDHPDLLASRSETGEWLNWLGLGASGVEVGVFRGDFSELLLRTWKCTHLTSVDPWREFSADEYVDLCNLSQSKQDENHAVTLHRLAKFGDRSTVLRTTSEEAARRFNNGSLDFVYLDAQHHYEAVQQDLALWHQKIRQGGVIGGHDYLDGRIDSGIYGVKQAVDEFAAAEGLRVIITREPNWPSWYARIA